METWSTLVPHRGYSILIDPIMLTEEGCVELEKAGTPLLIILTNGDHKRASLELKKRWQIPIATSAEAGAKLGFKPDIILDLSQQIYNLEIIPLSGGGVGEMALRHAESRSVVVGDALINLKQFELLPDKYCQNPEQLKKSLAALKNFDFLFFANGTPILEDAEIKLRRLLK